MSRPRGAMHISRRPKDTKGTLTRLLSYIFGSYKLHFVAVLIFIIISSVAGVRGSMFVQTVLDDYVTPMLESGSRDFSPLLLAVFQMMASLTVRRASLCLTVYRAAALQTLQWL